MEDVRYVARGSSAITTTFAALTWREQRAVVLALEVYCATL